MDIPVPNGQPGRQNDFARSRPLPNPRIAGSNGHSTLNLPPVVTVKTEVIDTTSPSSYRNSSPPTGVTQVVCLSSSGALSPLALQENELEPEDSSEHPPQSSSHASSISPSPRHVATSNLSGNEFPPLTINITVPVQHIHCSACEHNLNRKENLNSLSSRVAALGLSHDSNVSRAADPRSPLTQSGLVPRSPQ
jgi:hypothetical protein